MGSVWTLGLPVTADNSEIGLRPGFLALLDTLVGLTRKRGLSPITSVGRSWRFDRDEKVQVSDPQGALTTLDAVKNSDFTEKTFTPTLAGLYTIHHNERVETRLAHIESQEITEGPNPINSTEISQAAPRNGHLDLSPNFAMVLSIIVLLELAAASLPRRKRTVERSGN